MSATMPKRGRPMDPTRPTGVQERREAVLSRRFPELDFSRQMLADGSMLLTGAIEDELDVVVAVERRHGRVVRTVGRYAGSPHPDGPFHLHDVVTGEHRFAGFDEALAFVRGEA